MRPGGFGLDGPAPRDVVVLLGVLLVTYSLNFFASTAIVPAVMQLTSLVWRTGWLWQIATYPFAVGRISVISLLFAGLALYQFGRDVFFGLYRKRFWQLIFFSSVGAALVAVAVDLGMAFTGLSRLTPAPFAILQGPWMLLVIFVAAFGTAHRDATINLFFVLPLPARWITGLEILLAFIAFLFTHDFPGFCGLCAGVGLASLYIRSSGSMRSGKRTLREMRLRLEKWWIQKKLDRNRRKRGFKVIQGDKGPGARKGPWVN
jgi:hypothetical protein